MALDPKLIETLLTSDDAQARAAAAEQLARAGETAQPAAVALVRAAGDSAASVRDWATAALEELGPPMAGQLPELATLVANPQADIAYWAVTLLGRAGEQASQAAESIAASLAAHPASEVRQRAAWALGRIGVGSTTILKKLREAAASDDARLARLAEKAIAECTPSQ